MPDATGVAEVMLGLPGFRVLDAEDADDELIITVETIPELTGCSECGVVATAHDRMAVEYRDLPAFGRPVRLVWLKRRWRCEEPECPACTWMEVSDALSARCLLTRRAALECCLEVGLNARPVAQLARALGVSWHTVMNAVREYGQALVDDPDRVGQVRQLGVDETTWLTATRAHPTKYATSLVDLERRIAIDVVEGNSAGDLGSWLDGQSSAFTDGIRVVATDLAESYRKGLEGRIDQAARVADPFHVVRVANRVLDTVRRRVQNRTLGHRGRKRDPLYRIRKLMLTGTERLDAMGVDRMLLGLRVGDPDQEVLGAWLAKESVRDIYLADNMTEAQLLIDKAIAGCRLDSVPEIRSLGLTLARWREQILARHLTGASNGPTEGLNLLVKRSSAPGMGSAPSPTTGCASSCTQGASTGAPPTPQRHASAAGLPTQMRRASIAPNCPGAGGVSRGAGRA